MLRSCTIPCVLWSVLACGPLLAHSPAQFFEVLQGEVSSQVAHGVEVQTEVDAARGEVNLSGPKLFARGVSATGGSGKLTKAFLNWYQITDPQPAAKKVVSVLDPFRGDQETELRLGNAEYLLCPTQMIGNGMPAPIPHGLDFYKAYKVLQAQPVKAKVTVGTGDAKRERSVGKPVYVCIASQHWHHEEYTEASHTDQCYVVYELDTVAVDDKISMMDQFGLNQFQAKSNAMLGVTGKLLSAK